MEVSGADLTGALLLWCLCGPGWIGANGLGLVGWLSSILAARAGSREAVGAAPTPAGD
jgi:hypothetical protein